MRGVQVGGRVSGEAERISRTPMPTGQCSFHFTTKSDDDFIPRGYNKESSAGPSPSPIATTPAHVSHYCTFFLVRLFLPTRNGISQAFPRRLL